MRRCREREVSNQTAEAGDDYEAMDFEPIEGIQVRSPTPAPARSLVSPSLPAFAANRCSCAIARALLAAYALFPRFFRQAQGINASDIDKMKQAGLNTVEDIQ